MASTNKTPNYDLPQFIGTDKPSWLGDFNSAMLAIDTAIKGAADKADTASTQAESAAESASTAGDAAAAAQSAAEAAAQQVGSVSTIANQALSKATSAETTANQAKTAAETAGTKADTAQSTATAASASASQATQTANAANQVAQEARAAATANATTLTSMENSVAASGLTLKYNAATVGISGNPTGMIMQTTPSKLFYTSLLQSYAPIAYCDGNPLNIPGSAWSGSSSSARVSGKGIYLPITINTDPIKTTGVLLYDTTTNRTYLCFNVSGVSAMSLITFKPFAMVPVAENV